MDKGHVTLLVMLDLSAAFDTVDHGILLHRLQSKLGVRDKALLWFKSYLAGTAQQVSVDGSLSNKFNLTCEIPQGSCLGPLLFTIYASSLRYRVPLQCAIWAPGSILIWTCRLM